MSLQRSLAIGLTAWSIALLLVSRTTASEPEGAEMLTVRFLPHSSDEMRDRLYSYLSEVAEPELVSLRPGERLVDHLRGRCGAVDKVFLKRVREMNPEFKVEDLSGERVVQLSPCPYWAYDRRVTVREGEILSEVLQINVGIGGPDTQESVVNRNRDKIENAEEISAETVLAVPYITLPISFRVRSEFRGEEVAAHIKREWPVGAGRPAAVGATVGRFQLVAPVANSCDLTPGPAWPFDGKRVRTALESNLNAGLRSDRGPATILIADTGISQAAALAPRGGFLLRKSVREGVYPAREGVDDDRNGFLDDVYGAYMDGRTGFPRPESDYLRAGHGTQVAAVALGGLNPELTRLLSGRVRISVANLVGRETALDPETGRPVSRPVIPFGAVSRSLTYAHAIDAAILNWSIASPTSYPELAMDIAAARRLTIVVAAGNDGKDVDHPASEIFPASYGRDLPNLITVAAYDGKGHLARFSNRGAAVVHLAAPGCRVPTISYEGGPAESSGTSFAAPLVSFTAALLYSEGVHEPRSIKNRILASVDVVEGLKGDVESGGTLNVEKAVRIRDDIVVPRKPDGTLGEPVYGSISSTTRWKICGAQYKPHQIWKIVPAFGTPPRPMRVVVRGNRDDADIKHCSFVDEVVSITDSSTGKESTYRFSEIADLVPAL